MLDGLVLTAGMAPGNPGRHRAMLATGAVAPIVALDVLCARGTAGFAGIERVSI